uniref:Uncharacterized protein n=1 Tax=Coccolithus braarudii TaxID=221442 RepID=A0A7S0L2J9_9EUKA|mmetsp:Transcript_16782/g.36356  ORF Transcript_16782/g.36356 Transcript_16782/m.36356 type:complete len:340 (+) Transcript_16782:163-1182(+)|eukprot:CAMPEP_0183333126 /NCGR_PEP_ID=MMETSP0164_2-20130417/2089_1 /TAXON_ID=221442 /ORGANISM="Coccolithus pelagicus ssp braarudi, Strain PLY182g" /LENGTH=339 /DNA_ID=CAMNT_0025501967 /DNA_START=158 /DNA_END=1177 /DNA_ORIENTATION=-
MASHYCKGSSARVAPTRAVQAVAHEGDVDSSAPTTPTCPPSAELPLSEAPLRTVPLSNTDPPRALTNTQVDWLLVLAKCTVPAIMVGLSGLVAIPLNRALGEGEHADFVREALEDFAGGALIGTYALELTGSYILHDGEGRQRHRLVAATLLGTLISGQVQCAGQAFWPYGFVDSDPDVAGDKDAGDAVPFAIGFFVDGVVLAYERMHEDSRTAAGGAGASRLGSVWVRISPAFTSVLTLVMSIDNAIDGIGMYSKLDAAVMPAWAYYVIFMCAIYAGGLISIGVQRVPSRALQAAWYAFGAFAILDSGMELATSGLTTWVLVGFLAVWVLLIYGNGDS